MCHYLMGLWAVGECLLYIQLLTGNIERREDEINKKKMRVFIFKYIDILLRLSLAIILISAM